MGMIMKDGVPYGGVYPIDDVPTQGSSNTVKSGGVFSSLSNKVDKVEGKGLSTNDYDNTEKGKVDDNTSAIEAINYNGCCNKLPNDAETQTVEGITFTVNTDGTVTLSGTCSNNGVALTIWYYSNHGSAVAYRNMILSGAPKGSTGEADMGYYVRDIDNTWTTYGEGNHLLNKHIKQVTIRVAPNYAISGTVTFKPMIHDARLHPSNYIPYSMSNRELTESVIDLKNNTPRIVGGTIVVNLPQSSAYGFYYFFFPSGAFAVGKTITIEGANFIGSSTELKSYISAEPYAPTDAGRIYKIEANEIVGNLKNSPLLISYSVS